MDLETLGLDLTGCWLVPRRSGITELILPGDVWGEVIDHLASARPNEGVGLLASRSRGPLVVASTFYRGSNTDRSPTRYTMDEVEIRKAFWQMNQRGEHLVAVAHSHPRTPPVPSAGDLAEATLPGILGVIVAFEPVVAIRAWEWEFDAKGRAVGATAVPVEVPGILPGLSQGPVFRRYRESDSPERESHIGD